MLPLNLKPYAVNWIEKECKSSCDISSNDSMNLCIGLHGRLKLSIVGRNQILPKDGVIIISLHIPFPCLIVEKTAMVHWMRKNLNLTVPIHSSLWLFVPNVKVQNFNFILTSNILS